MLEIVAGERKQQPFDVQATEFHRSAPPVSVLSIALRSSPAVKACCPLSSDIYKIITTMLEDGSYSSVTLFVSCYFFPEKSLLNEFPSSALSRPLRHCVAKTFCAGRPAFSDSCSHEISHFRLKRPCSHEISHFRPDHLKFNAYSSRPRHSFSFSFTTSSFLLKLCRGFMSALS